MSWQRRHKRRRERQWTTDASLAREVAHIVNCALAGDSRVVSWGPLVLFSTGTGDAWMMDPADGLGRCLVKDGIERPPGIRETQRKFAVEWNCEYEFVGSVLVFDHGDGSADVIGGDPVEQIRRAARQMTGRKPHGTSSADVDPDCDS